MYPGQAVWPIWAASTLRATGILPVWDPAGQGTSLGHGSLHIYGFTFTISFTITYRSGRRAPTLEGGGHSCPFVSSCGDAARERDRFNQSSRDRLRVTHGIRNTWGGNSPQHATRPSAHLLIPVSVQDRDVSIHAGRSFDCLTLSARSHAVAFQLSFLELRIFTSR